MTRVPPPVVLDSARVIAYAFVDDIEFRRWGALYVGEKLLEHVPQLAICINLGEDMGPLLFHCNEHWTVIGTSGAETVEALKERAEKNYPGVKSRWVDLNTSKDDALRHYDAQNGGVKCSFCGSRPFEVDMMIEGKGAVICEACVEKYHQLLGNPTGGADAA
jgi:ClpX C4-type zinc finger